MVVLSYMRECFIHLLREQNETKTFVPKKKTYLPLFPCIFFFPSKDRERTHQASENKMECVEIDGVMC